MERPKVEIINETTITSNKTTDENGCIDSEITKTVSNRINLEGVSESFLMDYFGLKVTIDWSANEPGTRIHPEQE